MTLDISLSVINTNKHELLEQSLRALPDAMGRLSYEVIVVDNASSDGSAEVVSRDFPDIRLVRQPAPTGSSANFNAGLREASPARYFAVLHEDARPHSGCFEVLIDFLDREATAGCAAPRSRYPDGTIDSSARRFPSLWRDTMARARPLIGGSREPMDRYREEEGDAPFAADWVGATCLVWPAAALDEVGLFDEGFFIFYEEVDLSRRLRDTGRTTWLVPAAEVTHVRGVTATRPPEAIARHWALSRYRFYRKHHGALGEVRARAWDAAIGAARLVSLDSSRRADARGQLRAALDLASRHA